MSENRRLELVVEEPSGVARLEEHVAPGIPFLRGVSRELTDLALKDERRHAISCQLSVLSRWEDGSLCWVPLTFPVSVGLSEKRRLLLEWPSLQTDEKEEPGSIDM